jgi:helix-turn-helix protein
MKVSGKGMIFAVEREPTPEGQDRRTPADSAAGGSGWITTDVAAKALGVSPRTIRRFIDRGDLEGKLEEEGITRAWMVSIDSLHALRDQRKSEGHDRHESAEVSATVDKPEDTLADVLRDLAGRLEARIAEATELRTRLEITEQAESSLREERERLLADIERERSERDLERQRAEEELQRLRTELEAERSKGFWARLFGG